jgi:hypothetical protein
LDCFSAFFHDEDRTVIGGCGETGVLIHGMKDKVADFSAGCIAV